IKTPYLSKIIFRFYDNYNSAKEGLLKNEVEGFSPLIIEDVNFFGSKKGIKISSLSLPRYYAVFFNLKKTLFQKKEIRQALDLAISREELTKEILSNQALPLAGPISPGFFGYNSDLKNDYSPAEAKKIIDQFLSSDSKKENSENSEGKIKFTLSLPENLELIKVANYLKDAWEKIGINVELEILPLNELEKQVIQTRSYDALLFGEIIGQDSNLLSFWHSSQANDSGLNLSSFQNKELDKLLEETWQIDDKEKQEQNIKRIQEILKENKPAIFLYNPYYLYILPKKIKGNEIKYANLPSERLADIENWYIFTKRTLK
ncbi:MAG: ABC transporter substrate-binding protein, partial [Candidatus Paceibacterota bacterium]